MDKNETMYKKIQKLEQASRDLKEAHDYTEVLLKGKYHEAARHTWSDIPRPQEDTYIFEALVIALVISLSRFHEYVRYCLKSEEDHDFAGILEFEGDHDFAKNLKTFRDLYVAHSDKRVLPDVLAPGLHVKDYLAWNKNHTRLARILIKKSIRRVEEIKEKTYDQFSILIFLIILVV